jgi:hypothetical protein
VRGRRYAVGHARQPVFFIPRKDFAIMTISVKRVMAGAASLAIASSVILGAVGTAQAAATPPWEPDPSSVGGLTFYDAGGNVVTHGNVSDAPFASYVLGSNTIRAGDTKATLFGYLPKNGVAIGAWSGEAISTSPNFPNAGAPAPLNTSPLPLVSLTPADGASLQTLIGDFPNTATDAYAGLYQLRLKTSASGVQPTTSYDSADILISGAGASQTWQVVCPAPVATNTSTTLATTPTSPQGTGTPVTLTATISPAAAGTVVFKDGAAAIGSPVTVSGGTASATWTSSTSGAHSLTAVFTPSDPTSFNGSTSPAVPFQLNPQPAQATTTALSVNPTTATAFTAVTLQANVLKTSDSSALAAGSGVVKFYDNGSLLGQAPVTATGASLSYSNFTVGTHPLTATFVPTDPAVFNGSTSAAITFTATAPTSAPAVQNVNVTFPQGTLVISTPYSTQNPFDLGVAQLNAAGTADVATGHFGSASSPSQGVTITDERSGDLPWTASVTTTDFTDGANDVVNGQNLAFLNVAPSYQSGNAIDGVTKSISVNDVTTSSIYPSAAAGSDGVKGGPHQFATALHGAGSVYVIGDFVLTAPTSTPAGSYTATVTFTIA